MTGPEEIAALRNQVSELSRLVRGIADEWRARCDAQEEYQRAVNLLGAQWEKLLLAFHTQVEELQRLRLAADEANGHCGNLIQAIWDGYGREAALERALDWYRSLDQARDRAERQNRDTPPDGVKISRPEHRAAYESAPPPSSDPDAEPE